MKRLLSLILVTVMLLSLLPAYAAPAEGGSGITVKYDFTRFEGAAKGIDTKGVVAYDKSYGFWKYRTAGNTRAISLDAKTDQITGEGAFYVQYAPANTIDNDAKQTATNKINDFYFAYELYVPKAGMYDITLDIMQVSNYGADAQVYIFPATTANSSLVSQMKAEWGTEEKVYRQGDVFTFCNPTDLKKNQYGSKSENLGEKYFDEGYHIFVFAATESNEGTGGYANRYMGIKGITLDGGPDIVPMVLTSEFDKTSVTQNGGTAKMTVTAFMSDGTEEDYTDKVTYSVTGNATVAQDGTVTGGDEGVATVTATLELPGRDALTTSQTIKVASYGVKILYTAASDAIANESSGFLSVLDEKYTNGFYRFHGLSGETGTSSSAPGGDRH